MNSYCVSIKPACNHQKGSFTGKEFGLELFVDGIASQVRSYTVRVTFDNIPCFSKVDSAGARFMNSRMQSYIKL